LIEIIIGGIGYGFLLSLMVGPAFFMLIETSILKGVRSALFMDLGVLISDLMYVTVAFLFFQEVNALMESDNRFILKIIGGTCFILFGISNLLKTKVVKSKLVNPTDLTASNHVMMIMKGFTINAVNPGVLFYWLTLLSLLPDSPETIDLSRTNTQLIYIAIILITFFGIDVLKILGAKKLQDFLTPGWIRVVNLVLGFVLISFGSLFLIQGIVALLK
jgi:threonine/homoserine/homoserine lactone efflux protein